MKAILSLLMSCSLFYLSTLLANPISLISTESDPDAFIQSCVNVIHGNYCEATTDLLITGPDALLLQRFYTNEAGWKIFPERFLIMGRDPSEKSCNVANQHFEWTLALAGERSGGILPYNGWKNSHCTSKHPLKIDVLNQAIGMVNTYGKDMNGQTNHQNNQLHCKKGACELTLGDGTKRFYKPVGFLPSQFLGEQVTPIMAGQVLDPSYYLLTQEVLPSGNQLFFSYDNDNHLISIEMENPSGKILSWIHFSYECSKEKFIVFIKTSDERELTYHFSGDQLIYVSGSHSIPISYEYENNLLVKKTLPERHFVEIDYVNGKVKTLKGPNAQSGKPETAYFFSYDKNCTEVFDAMGIQRLWTKVHRLPVD